MSKSSFFEFHVAMSGVMTSRAALETISHNTANAGTVGYSRQVAQIRATTPLQLYNGRGMIGTGSEVYSIIQIRDVYLDQKYWGAQSILGEYSAKQDQLSLNQSIFQELEGSGLTTQFNELFDSLEDLLTNSGDITYRTNVLQQSDTLTTFLRDTYEAFRRQQRDVNGEVRSVVETINSLGTQIHTLNEKIRVSEAAGDNANDLRDQRALLVDELSKYVNVTAEEIEYGPNDKRFFVKIDGQDFVMNNNLRLLYCAERTYVEDNGTADTSDDRDMDAYRNPEDQAGLYDIFWGSGSGIHDPNDAKFNIYSSTLTGQLKGLIEVRDGNNGHQVTTGTFTYDAGTDVLRVPVDSISRPDISPSGGYMAVTNSKGQTFEVKYESFEIVGGEYVFDLAGDTTTLGKQFDGAQTVSIGNTTDFKGIPYYMSRLNDLARTFTMAVNFGLNIKGEQLNGVKGHVDGYNLDGEQGDPPTLFFTYRDENGNEVLWDMGDPKTWDPNDPDAWNIYKMTADNISVNSTLAADPRLMNTAGTSTGGVDDNREIIDSMIKIFSDDKLFAEGKLQDFVVGLTTELGIDIKQATNFETNYDSLSVQIENQRLSVSGVSINEEMANMIKYNQQFQASSRLVNIIDEIYSTLVNRLGVL